MRLTLWRPFLLLPVALPLPHSSPGVSTVSGVVPQLRWFFFRYSAATAGVTGRNLFIGPWYGREPMSGPPPRAFVEAELDRHWLYFN